MQLNTSRPSKQAVECNKNTIVNSYVIKIKVFPVGGKYLCLTIIFVMVRADVQRGMHGMERDLPRNNMKKEIFLAEKKEKKLNLKTKRSKNCGLYTTIYVLALYYVEYVM